MKVCVYIMFYCNILLHCRFDLQILFCLHVVMVGVPSSPILSSLFHTHTHAHTHRHTHTDTHTHTHTHSLSLSLSLSHTLSLTFTHTHTHTHTLTHNVFGLTDHLQCTNSFFTVGLHKTAATAMRSFLR
jgi:hypothetical protein